MRGALPIGFALLAYTLSAASESGYELWLRYAPLPEKQRSLVASVARTVVAPCPGAERWQAALDELQRGIAALTGQSMEPKSSIGDGSIIVGTMNCLAPSYQRFVDAPQLAHADGYSIRAGEVDGAAVTVIGARGSSGLIYASFAWLRALQSGADPRSLRIADAPAVQLRLLNHWDNLDRSVERGYAGQSLWDWWRLPDIVDPRYADYARANASVGINGAVLNNVNAQPEILTDRYLDKVTALADVFRPYGIKVYLSVRFSAPIDVGGLATADPLDEDVRQWWRARASRIYQQIPDFGGFLVKANSEGQPGPQKYGRSHADGANMLAEALASYGGVVMWRAFVYSEHDPEDRVKQAYLEFEPLDGQFADNVLIQVKNGPLDFQPREPFHPLFGAMPQTPLMMEFQITQEYLGFSTHLVYLGALYEEVLKSDTFADGEGSIVADVVDGSLHDQQLTGVAGVSNIGNDRDWSGSIFGQANWYAFGRLAWDPRLSAEAIAVEWLRMTFSHEPAFVDGALQIMMKSREAAVNYMTPLGLAHLMGTGHHYGPAPWVADLGRPEWNPAYYHRADSEGIGFDRTATGSNAVAQYAGPLAERYGEVSSTPDQYLLWFHHLSWDRRLRNGKSVWESLVAHYDRGVGQVEDMLAKWESLEDYVDEERFEKTMRYLGVQLREAQWWRDASIAFFADVSGRPLPEGVRKPPLPLESYKAMRFPYAPGH